jgi:hypothetical protein
MSKREIIKSSVSECVWKDGVLNATADQPWKIVKAADGEDCSTAARILQDGILLKIKPDRKRFSWNANHFHDNLKTITTMADDDNDNDNDNDNGCMLLFQAKARESISVALSTRADYSQEAMYEIHLGAVGNTCTVLKQRTSSSRRKVKSTSIPSRVCSDDSWISYWICLHQQTLYAGVGEIPGKECIGMLDVTTTLAEEEVLVVERKDTNMGESTTTATTTTPTAEESKTSNEKAMDDTVGMEPTASSAEPASKPVVEYVGLGNSAKGPKGQPLSLQKVVVSALPTSVKESLSILSLDDADLPVVVVDDNEDIKKMMEDYTKECQLRKARAEKFGIAYKEPEPDAFLPWSKAKRLRENPEKGFVTGLDVMDPEEVAKREARKARFGNITTNNDDDENEKTKEYLPTLQAWDKEDMLRPQRKDPPSSLWQTPSAGEDEERDSFAMEPREPTTWVAEKIHLFSVDWAAFKQIRNKDLMVSWRDYSYYSIIHVSLILCTTNHSLVRVVLFFCLRPLVR